MRSMHLVGGILFLGIFLVPCTGVCIPYNPVELYEGTELQQQLQDIQHGNKWGKLDQWFRDNGFRRVTGEFVGHNNSEFGSGRGALIPYKNDATQHGAMAVYVNAFDENGTRFEFWEISEFWRDGTGFAHTEYVIDSSGNLALDTQKNWFQKWAECSTAWCGGAAAGCALGNILDGEILFAPCYVVSCGTALVACGIAAGQ